MQNNQNFSDVCDYVVASESFQVTSGTLSARLCSEPIVMLSCLINGLVYSDTSAKEESAFRNHIR